MLFVDHFCEIAKFLEPFAHSLFYRLDQTALIPGAVYVVGREQLRLHTDLVRAWADTNIVVFSNPAEGSETMVGHLKHYGVEDLVINGKLRLICGGALPSQYAHMQFEHFLTQPLRFDHNVKACERSDEIFSTGSKPYKFLCLNGRNRPHRHAILTALAERRLLQQALWTNLDSASGPIQLLPVCYELDQYKNSVDGQGFVKNQLFNNEWGEIYIKPELYIDTYFSVVTETVFDYPYSFFTEKIAKPLAMGHPFVAVANTGFYRDLKNLGFRTFDSVIDESFDCIDSSTERLNRIVDVIADLCAQDLDGFLTVTKDICKYNQQHLAEFATAHMAELPQRFFNFINE